MVRRLLIANRGEIACRVARTCRALGIVPVAVCSDADRQTLHVREADEVVPLGGEAPAESYLAMDRLVEAALRCGADAIHPGYGFLAESAAFAERCRAKGLVFVGPSAEAIARMGSKLAAKERMERAGVPVLPSVDAAAFAPEALAAAAEPLGFPLLVKASAGGGGRGMRVVHDAEALPEAVEQARSEAARSFGDDALLLEPYLPAPHHVEVQVLGDAHGTLLHLFERDCSVQRRHQKILEETPSPVLDAELREAMGRAAVAAARAVAYEGAGTVEFLLDVPSRRFYFLEMNTRLQVEHPVTECVTGLDLVALQIRVAEGSPLPAELARLEPSGHALEARLYAEDPECGFLPQAGRLERFRVPSEEGIRLDTGVAEGDEVSPHYDPMLAKLIVHAPTRGEAARRLARCLGRTEIAGLRTNRDLLVRILEHPEFLAGRADTHFLERHDPAVLSATRFDARSAHLHAAAAALAAEAGRRRAARVLSTLSPGWRNVASQDEETVFEAEDGRRLVVQHRCGRDGLRLRVDGTALDACLHACAADEVELEVEGVCRRYRVQARGAYHSVRSALGGSELRELERFPVPEDDLPGGALVAPMPGAVIRVEVGVGDPVQAGAVLLVLESMKMQHPVRAGAAGRVAELRCGTGDQVAAGQVLAVLDAEEA